MPRNGRRNTTGTVAVYDQMTTYSKLLKTVSCCRQMASNIHSRQHLMGPVFMAEGPTLKLEFPRLRFSTLTTDSTTSRGAEYCDERLSVGEHISRTKTSNLHRVFCARYLWPCYLWRRCDTLCTSGFMRT